jgi:hypothetical protein
MSGKRDYSGKIYDPVFLCMIGAVILAIGSSVLLRVVTGGAASAHAESVGPPSPHAYR